MFKYLPPDSVVYHSQKLKFKGLDKVFQQINELVSKYIAGFSINPDSAGNIENLLSGTSISLKDRPNLYVCVQNNHNEKTSGIFHTGRYSPFLVPVYDYLIEGTGDKISENLLFASGLFSPGEIRQLNRVTSKVNVILKSFFERREILLVEWMLKFRIQGQKIQMIPEFNPLTLKLLNPGSPDLLNFAYTKSLNFKKYSFFILEAIYHND
ncbi:MAG: hypothetical protein HUU54_02245 [Ignavibacteriaceae bacterium]|nr:hypothetical protein [Ignavibacteriaceae bacterium]